MTITLGDLKMSRFVMGILGVALTICLITESKATVIYNNGLPGSSGGAIGAISDFSYTGGPIDAVKQRADDFVLQSGQNVIYDVHWWGFYGSEIQPSTDDFTVRIFADSGSSSPGSTPLETIVFLGDINRELYSSGNGAGSMYSYWAYIDPISLVPGDTYWLSIVNNTPDEPSWSWATASGVDSSFGRHDDTSAWQAYDREFAFQLTSIPEPSILALLSFGLAGLGFTRRRMKA